MFYGAPQKSCKASPFRSWFVLPQEHEQEDQDLHHLLVAQADLYCQLEHGNSLVYAGRPANWLRVGFGGYEWLGGFSVESLCHLTVVLRSPPGINRRRPRFSGVAAGSQFLIHNAEFSGERSESAGTEC
jgi:hypothetical protein